MVTTVQNFLLHHRHNRPIYHLMAGAGKLPESTFFNRDWLRNKTIFIFIFLYFGGVGGREGGRILSLQGSDDRKYRKIPKLSPGAYFEGLNVFGGAYIRRGLCTEGNLRFKIDWASLILGRKFTVFLSFTLYLGAISKYKPPGEKWTYIWRRFTEGFCVTSLGGLYFEGLIFGILRYVLTRSQVSQVCLENGKLNCER